jgi:hypothetical protein
VTQEIFCIDSMLKHCAANIKRRLSELPNVGPYTVYKTLKFLALQRAPYIYDISRLRVNVPILLKSGRLDLLEPSGPVEACNGIALPSPLHTLDAFLLHVSVRMYCLRGGPCA